MSEPGRAEPPGPPSSSKEQVEAKLITSGPDTARDENATPVPPPSQDTLALDAPALSSPDAGTQAKSQAEPALPCTTEEHLPEPDSLLPTASHEDTAEHPPLQIVDVADLNWPSVADAANPALIRSNIRATVERMEALLDQADGPGMLFEKDRADPDDKVIQISKFDPEKPLWIIGDLHGDLLALEAAIAAIREPNAQHNSRLPSILFLGDLFDDEGFGLEVLLRVFELIVEAPDRVCVIAGNHDEALAYDGVRFASSVTPSDFADFLNANLNHEWIERAGKLAVRLFARSPRALFFPDGLLAVHGGFPLADLHPALVETGDWNDPLCLSDFVWTRAHPKARKKLPNRFSRGSQFGYEDFAAFCAVSARLGRPVTRMVRGHDHVEERYAAYPAYRTHPVLTIVALSRRLSRESFGPYERVPAIAQYVEGALPVVHLLHIPAEMIRAFYPDSALESSVIETSQDPHI